MIILGMRTLARARIYAQKHQQRLVRTVLISIVRGTPDAAHCAPPCVFEQDVLIICFGHTGDELKLFGCYAFCCKVAGDTMRGAGTRDARTREMRCSPAIWFT